MRHDNINIGDIGGKLSNVTVNQENSDIDAIGTDVTSGKSENDQGTDREAVTESTINGGQSERLDSTNSEITNSETITIEIDNDQFEILLNKIGENKPLELSNDMSISDESMLVITDKLDNMLDLQVNTLANVNYYVTVLTPLICIIILFWWFINQFIRR